jgi:hypothetical protein
MNQFRHEHPTSKPLHPSPPQSSSLSSNPLFNIPSIPIPFTPTQCANRPTLPNNHLTLRHMVSTAKEHIDLFQGHIPRLGNHKPHKYRETEIDPGKHVESIEALFVKENGEELLTDDISNILGLGGHAYSLGADVHGEDFRGPDPGCCAPGWFVWLIC